MIDLIFKSNFETIHFLLSLSLPLIDSNNSMTDDQSIFFFYVYVDYDEEHSFTYALYESAIDRNFQIHKYAINLMILNNNKRKFIESLR